MTSIDWSKKKYLVTGGSGFIGSALVRGLVAEGARVRVLDDDSRGRRRRLADLGDTVEFVGGDVRDAATVSRALEGVDGVFHLAYVNGTELFYQKPELVLDVAVKGMVSVIDGCLARGVGELYLASSSEVYQTPPSVPTDESAPLSVPDVLNPRYSYGGGKILCELMAVNYGRRHFQRVCIFRPHNVYGPDMGEEHVVPQLSRRVAGLLRETTGPLRLPIQGDGQETRAFCFVDDMVQGVLRMVEGGEHLGIYHVGTDVETTIADLAVAIGRVAGRELSVVPGPAPAGATRRRCPDIGKLRALGYAPTIGLAEGLARAVPWYLTHAKESSHG